MPGLPGIFHFDSLLSGVGLAFSEGVSEMKIYKTPRRKTLFIWFLAAAFLLAFCLWAPEANAVPRQISKTLTTTIRVLPAETALNISPDKIKENKDDLIVERVVANGEEIILITKVSG